MEIASWLLLGLWGVTVGVVLSYARGPGGGWLLWGAAAGQAAGALYLASSSPTTELGVLGFGRPSTSGPLLLTGGGVPPRFGSCG